jgi:DNA polymerase alpha subunit B
VGRDAAPVQVVAVEGVITETRSDDESGEKVKTVKASRVVEGAPAARAPAAAGSVVEAGELEVFVAAGPYTTKDSWQYLPLDALLLQAADEKPDLVVLCGPFIDEKMDAVANATMLERTYEEIFFTEVVRRVNAFLSKSPATAVVIVPSLADAHADMVYPQPRFEVPLDEDGRALYEVDERITFARNPETIRCRSVEFALSTADMLKYFSSSTANNLSGDAAKNRACKQPRPAAVCRAR